MTKRASKRLLEAARQTGITVGFKSSGTHRVTAIIGNRTYGGINAAMDAITNKYLSDAEKRRTNV